MTPFFLMEQLKRKQNKDTAMKTIRYIFATLAAILLCLGLAAQSINVSGTVKDASGEPIPELEFLWKER